MKKKAAGLNLDNIRPISLTSNVVKLIERIIHGRITHSIQDTILSPCQIGFRPGHSIWCAHVDLESRIKLARRKREYAALVTLDVAKAYDTIEYLILFNKLKSTNLPKYITAWIYEFMRDREFYCYQHGISTSKYNQTRGVPQGAVLSPILFNVLLSTIPLSREVNVYVYADDIAFFTSELMYTHCTSRCRVT